MDLSAEHKKRVTKMEEREGKKKWRDASKRRKKGENLWLRQRKEKRQRAKRNAVKKIKAAWEASLLRKQKGSMGITCSGIKTPAANNFQQWVF